MTEILGQARRLEFHDVNNVKVLSRSPGASRLSGGVYGLAEQGPDPVMVEPDRQVPKQPWIDLFALNLENQSLCTSRWPAVRIALVATFFGWPQPKQLLMFARTQGPDL
jgi:hypothetical protein